MLLGGVDTNLVVALHALLTHASVTRAAKDVGLGQSSMSHALARLRAHFGDPLLVPVGRRLVLTERARTLQAPVAAAIAQLGRVFAAAEPFEPRTSRRIFRVLATDNVELFVLPRLSAMLQKSAPGIELRVGAVTDDWVGALLRGEADLKLGRRYAVPDGLETETLSEETFGCVVRRGHPVRARPTAAAYAALRHLVVAPAGPLSAAPATAVDAALRERGLARTVALTVPHFVVAPFVVAETDLALTAPRRLLEPFAKRLGLRPITLPFAIDGYELSQVWPSRMGDDAGLAWLRFAIGRLFRSIHR